MIDIRNLNKVYESENTTVQALKDVSISVKKGEIYGIIGLSGAGKSSLLRCINLLEKPTSGEIIINGKDMIKLNSEDLRNARKKIGMIFQHFNLLNNSTVFENVAFPLKISGVSKQEREKRVNELLEVVDLSSKKDSYPSQLSGGQKQRVGIARALANNPEIILSDEATSALDPTNTESILNLLKEINRTLGITILAITHEMDVIKKLCDTVAVMEDGVIVEEGSVVDIFSNPATATSKTFLKDMNAELPEGVLLDDANFEEEYVRAAFIGEDTQKPFISNMVKKYDVDAAIIAGNIENIGNTQIGNLLIKLSGKKDQVSGSIEYLKNNNIKVEVLKNHAL